MNIYIYNGKKFPEYLKNGNAGQYIFPIAQKWCQGTGLDIGGTPTCTFPGAQAVNSINTDGYDAFSLPLYPIGYDYIFSSHTLEHVSNYISALETWKKALKTPNGVLFLYLPHPRMDYWLPINNRKHLHSYTPEYMNEVFKDMKFRYVLCSEMDLFFSFSIVGIS